MSDTALPDHYAPLPSRSSTADAGASGVTTLSDAGVADLLRGLGDAASECCDTAVARLVARTLETFRRAAAG